ncbi:dehydrin HIRD11 [Actinidia eriantha]|uniref:dehydrin HIRD11 n=1 Tax=Actinidia eriantha TaxID=165200 RepID=UPI0025905CD2|nr:dehydrin HIRD11 [Actinidia eriantha]
MAGIVNKIGETLHIGGGKKEGEKSHDEHKPDAHGEYKAEQIKPGQPGERKEGFTDKIKDKMHGGEGGHEKGETKEKKKKNKKKHEDGHESSSSDSD